MAKKNYTLKSLSVDVTIVSFDSMKIDIAKF